MHTFNFQFPFLSRVAAAKENMINQHRQAVAKLRKLLMDEDKHFQLTQQQERAEHDAAMVSIIVPSQAFTPCLIR